MNGDSSSTTEAVEAEPVKESDKKEEATEEKTSEAQAVTTPKEGSAKPEKPTESKEAAPAAETETPAEKKGLLWFCIFSIHSFYMFIVIVHLDAGAEGDEKKEEGEDSAAASKLAVNPDEPELDDDQQEDNPAYIPKKGK